MKQTKLFRIFLLSTIILSTIQIHCMKNNSNSYQRLEEKPNKKKKKKFTFMGVKLRLKNPFKSQKKRELFLALRLACFTNNLKKVIELLNQGVKQFSDENYTALFWACWHDNLEMAKQLIQHNGAHTVNTPSKTTFFTPLFLACRNNNEEMVNLLLKNGARKSIDKPVQKKDSPLYQACFHGNHKIFDKLITRCKKTINMAKEKDYTPLYNVCFNTQNKKNLKENFMMFKKLIFNGAKIIPTEETYAISPLKIKIFINLIQDFDKANNAKDKFKILQKNKSSGANGFLTRLAYSRFLLENINKKNSFFIKLLKHASYKKEAKKALRQYKEYILRRDIRKKAKKFLKNFFKDNLKTKTKIAKRRKIELKKI